MRRDVVELWSPAMSRSARVIAYGHWGRPVLAFPAEAGWAEQFEQHGMLDALAPLLDAGRMKLYCVDSVDGETWSRRDIPTEERARRHGRYESWVLDQVVPFVHADCGSPAEIIATGVSLGAFHAVTLALRRADLVPVAVGLSGNYDPTGWHGWGETGDATYFANPSASVPNLGGDHLAWLQSRLSVLLVVGQGPFETHPTGALPSTVALAAALANKGIRCELDVWGHDVAHDWPWWGRQLARHLPRLCPAS